MRFDWRSMINFGAHIGGTVSRGPARGALNPLAQAAHKLQKSFYGASLAKGYENQPKLLSGL
jgi:hypothetical protein